MADKIKKTEEQWRKELTPIQYAVTREKATERPFSGEYEHVTTPGTYRCICCGEALFESDTKFDAGCGWPSFSEPVDSDAVEERTDSSHGVTRTEVVCKTCGGHLGHVFDDGPADRGGQRFCINSCALDLDAE